MNVAENLMLQQMPVAANMPKAGGGSGSKDQAGSFQDMMDKAAAQDSTVDTGKDKAPADQASQGQKTDGVKTEQKAPAQKKDGEDGEAQELHGDPNAVNYVADLFRPEIVEISEPAAMAEAPVEAADAAAETVVDAGEVEIPVETAPVVQEEAPVQEKPQQFQEAVEERLPQTETVREGERPVETERAEAPREDAAPEEAERVTDTGELREVRHTEETSGQDDEDAMGEAAEMPRQVFQDVKAEPVKVGENYEPVDTQEPEMDGKLAVRILQAMQDGVEKIQIQLNPANLGALTIEMTRDADGALQVVLHTSNSKAAGLLSQHLDGLHAALQSYGANQPVHVEVERGQESQEQHMFQQADPDGKGQQQQQRQEHRQENEDSGEDFLQKLRLGLAGLDD